MEYMYAKPVLCSSILADIVFTRAYLPCTTILIAIGLFIYKHLVVHYLMSKSRIDSFSVTLSISVSYFRHTSARGRYLLPLEGQLESRRT